MCGGLLGELVVVVVTSFIEMNLVPAVSRNSLKTVLFLLFTAPSSSSLVSCLQAKELTFAGRLGQLLGLAVGIHCGDVKFW